ncbi:MAG: hypothetical protein ACTJLL_02055 [Anaplasma sp.]
MTKSSSIAVGQLLSRDACVGERARNLKDAIISVVFTAVFVAATATMSSGGSFVMVVLILCCVYFSVCVVVYSLKVVEYHGRIRSIDRRAPIPAVTGDGVQCFQKLSLTPVAAAELEKKSEQDKRTIGSMCDKFQPQQGRLQSMPCLSLSARRDVVFLQAGGEIFEVKMIAEPLDIPHNFKGKPSSLSIQPRFLQGVRVAVSECKFYAHNSCRDFPYGIEYEVIYDKLLDRSIVMETMLGLRLNNDARLLKFSGDLLSGYVAIYHGLLWEFLGEKTTHTRADMEQFLRSPECGLKFAYDLVQYWDAFEDIVTKNREVLISDANLQLIRRAREVVQDMVQRDPDFKAVIEAEGGGTSTETLRMLYMLKSPYEQFLNIASSNSTDSMSLRHPDLGNLTAHFLINPNLRKTLVAQTLKWALAAVDKYGQELADENATQLLVSKALAQNGEVVADFLPIVCTTIPGLIETVLCAVKAFKGIGNVATEEIFSHFLRYASLIPGFTDHGLSEEEVGNLLRKHFLFYQKFDDGSVSYCIRAMALTRAITSAKSKSILGKEMEDYLIEALDTQARENNRFEYHSCVREMHTLFLRLEDYARLDGKKDDAYIQELVAYDVAFTLRQLMKGRKERSPIDKCRGIATKMLPPLVGVLLEKSGDLLHRRLGDSMFYTKIGGRHYIPACAVDVDVGPKLKHLASFIKPDNVAQMQHQGSNASGVADEERPSHVIGSMQQTASQAQIGQQHGGIPG